MSTYETIKAKIEEEAKGSPARRTQQVPCAFCVRGGNGEKSCASGLTARRYSKFKGCFAGVLLAEDPTKGSK